MSKESKVVRLNLDTLEKLETLSVITSKTVREVAEKIIVDFYTRVMNNEENAKKILDLQAKLVIRQQILEVQMSLRTKDGEVV